MGKVLYTALDILGFSVETEVFFWIFIFVMCLVLFCLYGVVDVDSVFRFLFCL